MKSIFGFERAAKLPELKSMLTRELKARGFIAFNYGCMDYVASFVSSMSADWQRRYVEQRFYHTDRLVDGARRRTAPFAVADALTTAPDTSSRREMETRIAPHYHGVIIPIHCPEVGFSCAAFFTDCDRARFDALDAEHRSALTLIALEFHEAARPFYRDTPRVTPAPRLTNREALVLGWAAKGKTSWEIAAILKLAEPTVNNHLANARRKLGVRTRAEAVALAIRHGLLAS